MVAWWTMTPGPERKAAKAESARRLRERPPRGSAKDTEQDGQRGFLGSGGFWPYRDKAAKRVAFMGATSGLYPSHLLDVVVEGDTFSLRGSSGTVYALYLDNVNTFRACYKSATCCEKRFGRGRRKTRPAVKTGDVLCGNPRCTANH